MDAKDLGGNHLNSAQYGITLRQHFAGLAMQAGLASLTPESDPVSPQDIARCAVMNADALLAELAKDQP